MSINDYSEDDCFYTQGFEKDGVVSIWVGLKDNTSESRELDVLQDLCGVGYYDVNNQESNCFGFEMVELESLIKELSYSYSFIDKALASAKVKSISNALWVTVQYDFEYDPVKVSRKVFDDPIFIGSFTYKVGL